MWATGGLVRGTVRLLLLLIFLASAAADCTAGKQIELFQADCLPLTPVFREVLVASSPAGHRKRLFGEFRCLIMSACFTLAFGLRWWSNCMTLD